MATLGAELGCERYLASTVVTGSGQRSGAFLTKLRRNNVFVLALRAFHCRPRRKKRARCAARVTSHMIGDKAILYMRFVRQIPAMLGSPPAFQSGAAWGVSRSAGTHSQRLGFASRQRIGLIPP